MKIKKYNSCLIRRNLFWNKKSSWERKLIIWILCKIKNQGNDNDNLNNDNYSNIDNSHNDKNDNDINNDNSNHNSNNQQ